MKNYLTISAATQYKSIPREVAESASFEIVKNQTGQNVGKYSVGNSSEFVRRQTG